MYMLISPSYSLYYADNLILGTRLSTFSYATKHQQVIEFHLSSSDSDYIIIKSDDDKYAFQKNIYSVGLS